MIIIFWLATACFGYYVVGRISSRLSRLEQIALGILVGFGLHTILYYFILVVYKSAIHSGIVSLVEMGIVGIGTYLGVNHPKNVARKMLSKIPKVTVYTVLGVITGISILTYTWIQATYWPVYEPDAIHLYDYRAQRLLKNDANVLFEAIPYEQNGQYPPFTSLLHLFQYQYGAENPKSIYALLFSAWYLCIVSVLKRATKSLSLSIWAANIIIGYPGIWWQSFQAMTNVVYCIYICLAIFYLNEDDDKSPRFPWLSSICTAISMFTRTEPFWLIPLVIVTIKYVQNKKLLSWLTWSSIPLSVFALWSKTGHRYQQETYQIISTITSFMSPTRENTYGYALQYAIENMTKYVGILIFIFIMMIVISLVRREFRTHWVYGAVIAVVTYTLGIANYILRDPYTSQYNDSFRRMSIIMIPPIVAYLAVSIANGMRKHLYA